jgi:hypothetical protein
MSAVAEALRNDSRSRQRRLGAEARVAQPFFSAVGPPPPTPPPTEWTKAKPAAGSSERHRPAACRPA